MPVVMEVKQHGNSGEGGFPEVDTIRKFYPISKGVSYQFL